MKTVTVRKEDLLERVEANRARHRDIFEKALEGYRNRAVELLEEHIERIRDGKVEKVHVILPRPEDHTDDYDRVIEMINMSVDDELELDEREFSQYVQDNWMWKNEFLAMSATYTGD